MITVSNINKSFEGHQALKELSIHVNTGSIYGLVGTNGSGKTTLIKHLTGVLKQDSGDITFDGEKVFENTKLKEKIGFIPDNLTYLSDFTLKEAVRYYKSIYSDWDQERCDEMLAKFHLAGIKTKIQSFSKGMQKQAAFVLTMSTHPKFLILDEPIDGLDPIVRKLVWKYIVDDVSDNEMTVLVSSHNLKEMEGICDCIGILDRGEIRIERDLDELKSDIHKVQVAFSDEKSPEERYAGLNILHKEQRGSVDLIIVRNERELVRRTIEAERPLVFDMLPLTLEEIFIYELGGEDYDIKDILF